MAMENVQFSLHWFSSVFEAIDAYAVHLIPLVLHQSLFFLVNFSAIPLAFVLQWILTAPRVGENVRHLYCLTIGLLFSVISLRWSALNIVIPTIVSYPLLKVYIRSNSLGRTTAAIAMAYLSVHHIYRLTLNYGEDIMDCSVLLMIWTQKMTYLAWSLRDGQLPESELSDESHKKSRMNELPSFLAYSSFLLGFLGFQIIPGYSYKEYEKFMKGKHLVHFRKPMAMSKKLDLQEEKYPSPNWMVLTNLPVALAYGYMLRILMPYFSYQFMSDDRFVERFSFLFKLAYCVPCGFMFRLRFYFAWKLGQSICYAAGFGFSGWTEDGKEQWELVRNGELTRVESCSNWKELWDTWNNMTSKWLRFICYSRIQNKSAAAAITFLFSAMWHGFHPGYYIQFAHSYLFVLVGRKIRKTIRPHFQDSYFKKIMYNCVTWVGCQLSMCYAIIPMSELQLSSTFVIFRSLYFYMSWIAIFLLIVLQPKRPVESLQLSGTSEDQRQKVDDRKREGNESRKKK